MSEDSVKARMIALRLAGVHQAYEQQALGGGAFSDMPFVDRLEHLLATEMQVREDRLRSRLLRQARFKHRAAPDGILFDAVRGLDKSYIAELLTCQWIKRADNVLISGASGTGKSWIGCALGMAAVQLSLQVRYVRTNVTLEEMRLAHLDGSIAKFRAPLISAPLLILDDFGIAPIPEQAKEDLLELLEGRIDNGATMVIGQLDPDEWHGYLDSPHLADAIMDRLVQRAHRLKLKGGSMRARH
ncbi:MAG: IS21-like element helper ATPase IstB [Novosphingobium sp.]|nr:IS21-like element helper ATPase IstB [Novosphingobium sp.]